MISVGQQVKVERSRTIGTNFVTYTAWEPGQCMGTHHNISSRFNDGWYGQVGSKLLPDWIEALEPGSYERVQAVAYFQMLEHQRGYAYITARYPHLDNTSERGGSRFHGTITVVEPEVEV